MPRKDDGFTLIEALVATTVFALVMASLYQGLAVGWRSLKKAKAEEVALSIVARELASSGIESPLAPSMQSGTSPEGVTWQTEISPYRPPQPDGETSPYQGYWVTVTVRWQEGRFRPAQSMQFTTLKLKRSS